jgi:hypothetical protein
VYQATGRLDTKGAIALRHLGSKIRATLEDASEREDLGRDERTGFSAESFIRQRIRLTHSPREGGKYSERSLSRDSNQLPDFRLMEDVTITISVIEGLSKGLVYEMNEYCITLGRTGGGADFQFNEPEASEIQCIAAKRQNGLCLYDAVSIHGTFVNDQRIAAAELTHMSTFRVGSSLLLVKVHPYQPAEIC